MEKGFDTIVNINHYHSNQARFVAAASAKNGLKCHMVAVDMVDAPVIGNLSSDTSQERRYTACQASIPDKSRRS